jgi:hypothetical protein
MQVTDAGLRKIHQLLGKKLKSKFQILHPAPGKFLVVATVGTKLFKPSFQDLHTVTLLYRTEMHVASYGDKDVNVLAVPKLVKIAMTLEGGLHYFDISIGGGTYQPTLADLRAGRTLLHKALAHAKIPAAQVRTRAWKDLKK